MLDARKKLAIIGAPGTEIQIEDPSQPVFRISASSGIYLASLDLGHVDDNGCASPVVDIQASFYITITDANIHGSGQYGIFADAKSEHLTLRQNVFLNCTKGGLHSDAPHTSLIENNFFNSIGDIVIGPEAMTTFISKNNTGGADEMGM